MSLLNNLMEHPLDEGYAVAAKTKRRRRRVRAGPAGG